MAARRAMWTLAFLFRSDGSQVGTDGTSGNLFAPRKQITAFKLLFNRHSKALKCEH